MAEALLARHIGQPQRYWVADAYADSMTPLGFDIFWTLTLLPNGGRASFEIETFELYTNSLLNHIRLQGRWYSVEATSKYYLVALEDTQAMVLAGTPEDLNPWIERERHVGIGLRVTASSISLVEGLP